MKRARLESGGGQADAVSVEQLDENATAAEIQRAVINPRSKQDAIRSVPVSVQRMTDRYFVWREKVIDAVAGQRYHLFLSLLKEVARLGVG